MNSLALDPVKEVERISEFLRRQLMRPPRRGGYVVGLSGGVDSAVTASIACRAVGSKKVFGVLLPEKESQGESLGLAQELAASLGVETITEDLTPTLAELGVYSRREDIVRRACPEFSDGWSYRLRLPGDLREHHEMNVYSLEAFDPEGEVHRHRLSIDDFRQMQAATNVKQRLRMVRLYEYAESRGYLVAGTTNRSETLQGFFVRYGDGGVDVEPLEHLFKTQVYALARFLEVPEGTINRPASPDTYSAAVDDADFFFRLPYDVVDPVLVCLENDAPPESIPKSADLSEDDAKRAHQEALRRYRSSERSRELPPTLTTSNERSET